MRTEDQRARELDRAYVQSRVIETALEQLESTLEDVDPALSADVSSYATSFGACVRHLREANLRVAGGKRRQGTAAAV